MNDRWFDGHFEGAPVLPGVAHLALAVEACGNRPLRGLRGIRFMHPIRPGDAVEVQVAGDRFEIRCNGVVASTGTLIFR